MRPGGRRTGGHHASCGGLGAPPPRPRRADLHRPARPRGHPAAGLPSRRVPGCARGRAQAAARARDLGHRRAAGARGGRGQPRPADRHGGAERGVVRSAGQRRDAAVPDRRGRPGVRGAAAAVPLPGPAQGAHGRRHRAAPPRGLGHPPPPGGPRLPGDRDAGAHPLHARGRARLPGAQPRSPGIAVRAAAVAPDLQAAADDRRLRALLPDRPLLPRRVLARRPPARVHPARRGAGVRGRGRRDRHDRPADARGAGAWRRAGARARRADGLRRGHAALRQRPPRPPHPVRDRRPR